MTEERIKLLEEEKKKIKVLEKTMTVAKIKEYIDEVENKYLKAELMPIFTNANLEEIITKLRSMLDELEDRPKAKWEQTDLSDELYADIERCTNCGYETLENGNFCANCGARMNDELKEKV